MIIERFKVKSAGIYHPTSHPEKAGPDQHWLFGVLSENEHLKDTVSWRPGYASDGQPRISFKSKFPPLITCALVSDYGRLSQRLNLCRIRNIPVDRIFSGATVDVVLNIDGEFTNLKGIIIRDIFDLIDPKDIV